MIRVTTTILFAYDFAYDLAYDLSHTDAVEKSAGLIPHMQMLSLCGQENPVKKKRKKMDWARARARVRACRILPSVTGDERIIANIARQREATSFNGLAP